MVNDCAPIGHLHVMHETKSLNPHYIELKNGRINVHFYCKSHQSRYPDELRSKCLKLHVIVNHVTRKIICKIITWRIRIDF